MRVRQSLSDFNSTWLAFKDSVNRRGRLLHLALLLLALSRKLVGTRFLTWVFAWTGLLRGRSRFVLANVTVAPFP